MNTLNEAAVVAALLFASGMVFAQAEPLAATAPDEGTNPFSAPGDAKAGAPASIEATEASPDSPAAPQRRATRAIEEIVVTAQKREENLKDVPISVVAFSGDKLEALGVGNPNDLPRITPGLQYDSLVGYSLVYIRGIGTDQFLPSGDASVTTYIDGIYTPFAHGLAQEFGKIQRIEVLKGPQGTLFGRNSIGGAINIVTVKPERVFSGSASIEGGEFNSRKGKVYLTAPVTEEVQVGFSAFDSVNDSYYHRPNGSRFAPFPLERTHGEQLKINWDITEDLALTLTGLSTRQDGLYSVVVSSLDVKPLFRAIVKPDTKAYENNSDTPIHFRSDNDMAYGQLSWTSPYFFDIKLLGSHQDIITDTNFDFEGSSAPLVTFHPHDQGARFTTAELQILSNKNAWLADRFKWIGGFYYFHGGDAGFRDLEVDVAKTLTDPLLLPTLTSLNHIVKDVLGGLPLGVPSGIALNLKALVDTDAYAGYAQGTFNFTDELALTLGARYNIETRKLLGSTIQAQYADRTDSPVLINYGPQTQDAKNFSPKATLDYKLFGDSLLFATAQRGFKSGTFNVVNIYVRPDEVKPETITSFELGIKGTFLSGSLQYSAAVFQNTIKNLQVLLISLESGGAVHLENAGKVRVRGGDFDLTWQPLRVSVPGLVLTGSGAILRGKYLSYPNATGFNPTTGIADSNLDFTGNTSVRTPKYTFATGVNYTFDVPGGSVEAGANGYYNDGYFFDAQNVTSQKRYATLGAQAAYLYEPLNLRLTVFGKNLTGTHYFYNKFQTDFNTVGTYAPPRMIGARLDYSF